MSILFADMKTKTVVLSYEEEEEKNKKGFINVTVIR